MNGEIYAVETQYSDTGRVERIWRLKAEFGVLDGHVNSSREPVEFFRNIAKEAAAKGLTLVSDDRGLFPLDRERIKSVKIVGVTPDDKEYETLTALCDEFEKRGIRATVRRKLGADINASCGQLRRAEQKATEEAEKTASEEA